ncbi:MAG: hypothetical protein ACREHD_01650 [Pirellulales bacterium]
MDRQQIGLKLALDHLGLPARLGTFDDRLILQKAVYLAQAAGVDLGYFFHWYLRGPYSSSLTRDAFAMVSEINGGLDESEGWKFDEKSIERLARLKPLIDEAPLAQRAARLELLASVLFLLLNKRCEPADKAGLRDVLLRYGKEFTQDEIDDAVEKLRQYGLVAGQK